MGDRYRYARPRSPVMYNPARASLPITVYATPSHEHHVHAVPTSRREVIANPRTSVSSVGSAGPVTTTTYKVTADPLVRTARGSSRTRSSTLDSSNRPTIVTSAPRTQLRPVVHSATGGRPSSPLLKNPYRSSEEEYYAVPATSRHGHHHHRKRYSATMDNADMHKLAKERESDRLRIGAREERGYTGTTRARPIYTNSAVRHPDTVAADYGDNGYGYTNPRDLVQYDLSNTTTPRHHARRDSFEGGRAPRPSSITSYQDLANPRVPYDTRERGPPPTTRGFGKIQPRGGAWEQPSTARMPAVPPPPPMEPIQRPARVEPPFEVEPPRRRESLTRRHERPVSLYHNEPRRESQRDEYYEARDEGRRERPHRHERYEDQVDQRGFGIRPGRAERVERVDRVDRLERSERSPDDRDRKEHKEHKGSKDALATGLSIAGAALGVNTLKKVRSNDDRDDREEREERRRRLHDDDYDDEPRRRRETRDEQEPVDLNNRDHRERRYRDGDLPPPPPGPPQMKPEPPIIDLKGRDPKERYNSRDDRRRDERPRDDRPRDDRPRDDKPRDERPRKLRDERDRDSSSDSRERDRTRRHRSEASKAAAATAATAAAVASTAIDSREDSSASDDARPRSRAGPRSRYESSAAPAPFNPKDTMDLKALKEALNKNESSAPKEPVLAQRTPRESVSTNSRELADIRTDLNSSDDRGRELAIPVPNKENRPLRVVSPPREKPGEKPVKGILRAPREKFPEDPSPIREGVAPLKDAKKDGVPPDARWTKISRKLVNPAALEAGKERFEVREDFVIVLRVLSRDEVQGYAEVTERIRAAREELERQERRRARRERHERHKRERSERGDREPTRSERSERRHRRNRDRGSESESDTTDDSSYEGDRDRERPKMIEPANPIMSGGLGEVPGVGNSLREDPNTPGQYIGYTRNPPPPGTSVASTSGRKDKN